MSTIGLVLPDVSPCSYVVILVLDQVQYSVESWMQSLHLLNTYLWRQLTIEDSFVFGTLHYLFAQPCIKSSIAPTFIAVTWKRAGGAGLFLWKFYPRENGGNGHWAVRFSAFSLQLIWAIMSRVVQQIGLLFRVFILLNDYGPLFVCWL